MNTIERKVFQRLNDYIIPEFRNILTNHNEVLFRELKGNCYLQTAFVSCYFLNRFLPNYKWAVYENYFIHKEYSQEIKEYVYQHAYVIGECNEEYLLMDLGREPLSRNVCKKIKDVSKPYRETEYTEINLKPKRYSLEDFKNTIELYSGKLGYMLLSELDVLISLKNI